MKAFKIILTFSLILIISSEVTPNCTDFEPIDEFDLSRVAGKSWYVIFTYKNGLESNISCSISDIKESLDIDRYIFYDDGSEKIVSGKINIELMDESEPGILLSTWPPGYPSKKLVVYNDYKITMIVGCFKNEGTCRLVVCR